MTEYRLRLCYGKTGRLRFLSHLEVARSLERAIRRAGLPFLLTQGFSPHMRIAFGPALPVGTAGEREYLDVYLARYSEAEETLRRLREVSPSDLGPREARYVAGREPALSAAATIAVYEVRVSGEGIRQEEVSAGLEGLLAAGEFAVEHKGKRKVFDLARSVPKDPRATSCEDGVVIDLTVRMGPQGSLRPDALVTAALTARDLRAAVTTVTRKDILIESEEGVWTRPV